MGPTGISLLKWAKLKCVLIVCDTNGFFESYSTFFLSASGNFE